MADFAVIPNACEESLVCCKISPSGRNDNKGARNDKKARRLQRPGIEHLRVGRKVLYVARDDGEAVALRRCHQQAVHHRQRLPRQLHVCGDLRPDMERGGVERQGASGEALFYLAQPGGELLAARRVGLAQLEDAFLDFADGDHAKVEAGFVLFVQPVYDLLRGSAFRILRKGARVEQPTHNKTPKKYSVRGELVEP